MHVTPDEQFRLGEPRSERDAAFLEGSLASFFRLDDGSPAAGSPAASEPAGTAATPSDAAVEALAAEVSALRRQVEALTARLTGTLPRLAPQEPAADDDLPD